MTLPEPSRSRWQPLRSGLVDLYRYDEQEFQFEDGRLLLRGNNGTGKSRVLALQLPFLLDGEVAPYRLEPDGDPAKRVEWNLLMNRYERRLGYTWLEFGRRDEQGVAHYLTLGCGMNAVKGKGAPTRWFFLTSKRMGQDLSLVDNRVTLTRERLKAALGPEGEIHETAEGWRSCVDRALFRLGPRYRPLMDLLVQLRQPQLSRDLDEGKLSRALSMALRPLSSGVVEPLAEAFRALETDRAELDGLSAASEAATEFLGRYQSYAAVAARRRAGTLRSKHAAYEAASRAARQASEALAAARGALKSATAAHQEASALEADASTRLSILQQAPAMDRARELEHAEVEVKRASAEATRAAETLRAAQGRENQRATNANAARGAAEHAAMEAERLHQAFARAAEPVGLAVEPDRPTWSRKLATRRAAAATLERADKRLSEAEQAAARAARTTEERQSDLDHAREAETLAYKAASAAGEALLAALAAWSPRLIALDLEAALAAAGAWLLDPRGRSPLADAVAEAERQAVSTVEAEKAVNRVERQARTKARDEHLAEIARLSKGGHAPPPPWPARQRDAAAPGAPLWRLCDFKPDLPASTRAGVEAALEGAGLLDALVTPTGEVLPPGARDAALTLDAPVVTPSLLDLLVPLEQPTVPLQVVEGLLARIGLGAGAVWVDGSGQYALGPLRGAWQKAEAEHIGETAREAARQRRLAELRAEVARLDLEIRALDEARAMLDARLAAIRAEARAQPDDTPARETALNAARAAADRARASDRLVEAERILLTRREEEQARRAEREDLARDLGLVAWAGRARELEQVLSAADGTAADHYAAARRRYDAETALRVAETALAEAAEDRGGAERSAAEAERARRVAAVTADTLRETHGAAVADILSSIAAAKLAFEAATAARKAAEDSRRKAERDEATTEKEAEGSTQRLGQAEAERDASVRSLVALVEAGLLAVLDRVATDRVATDRVATDRVATDRVATDLHATEPPSTTTRTVELARRLEEQLSSTNADDGAWARVRDNLHRDLEDLRRALLEHRWDPVLRTVDDLYVVEVSLGDGPLRIPDLRARLTEEVRARGQVLTEREREVIENHLVGELAMELHDLIHKGERLVRDMSGEVEARATSTGMRLRFDWRLREDAGPAVAEARRRLMRQGAGWSAADRDLIAQFLKDRLDRERQTDRGATWQQQIERAFDYREWHSFIVERHQDGQWHALTRRTHGTGSGGEKAIALTIPQLAAAAAYYKNADKDAPRLILLDEAFVGVDSDMRAKCMGLFATFDLDFMMTSEREWGCYATLPGVAICQLTSAPGVDAVDVVRWVWNGRERRPA